MPYTFKIGPEAVWALIVAVTTAASQFVLTSAQPTDWRVWGIALLAAVARAALGFLFAQAGPQTEPKG